MLIRSPPGSRTALRVLRLAFSFASPLAAGAVSILLPPLTRLSLDAIRVLSPAFSFASPLAIGADIYSIALASFVQRDSNPERIRA